MNLLKKISRIAALLAAVLLFVFTANVAQANEHEADAHGKTDEFNISETLFHHILESHDWHITDIPSGTDANGKTIYTPISISLPWIVYTPEKGLDVFFINAHNHHEFDQAVTARGYNPDLAHHGKIASAAGGTVLYDLSLSKTPFQMLIVALLMIFVFTSVAGAYKKNAGQAPKGMQSLFEPIIVFVRDEIAVPNLKHRATGFTPYLLTLFFFIWFSNLLGLTPFNSNIAGNISITIALSTLTFLITQFSGTKDYWAHIFWFPGVPVPVKFIMMPVELVGIITKPFSLTIRLFANIAGGHFMVLSLVCLIFLLGKNGASLGGAIAIAPMSVAFTLFIMVIEVLVAILQAYVFTLLTAVFIGAALESHSHDDHGHGHSHEHAH